YHRDQTGLDYADQRYYNSAIGRFLSADPYEASGGATEPNSWGRGVYVHGDPANFNDAIGLYESQADQDQNGEDAMRAWYLFLRRINQLGPGTTSPPPDPFDGADFQGAHIVDGLAFKGTGSVSEKQKALISSTRRSIAKAWSDGIDPDCEGWFSNATAKSGLNLGDFLSRIDTLMGAGEIVGRWNIGGVTGSNLTLHFGTPIIFNTGGAFFRDLGHPQSGDVHRKEISALDSNTDQQRAMIMLHEWAHLLQAQGFLSDGPTSLMPGNASAFNADLLWQKCNKTIKSLSGKK
ncbi:MAG: RHS repeat-associated core domain-containing protein, partial [Pseudomonadota bacterium]